MKKFLLFIFVMVCMSRSGFAKDTSEHFYVKNMYGDVNVGYATKTDSYVKHWYLGLRGDLSFLNWTNKYDNGTESGSDKFSFKSVAGADVFVGYKFNNDIRAEIELGYIGKYSESETEYYGYDPEKSEFSLSTSYLLMNGYYDFNYGLYAGAGIGATMIDVTLDNTYVNKKDVRHFSLMGALMFGWNYDLDDSVSLDLRYRLGAFHGDNINLDIIGGGQVKTEVGYILDNTFSVGIQYHF